MRTIEVIGPERERTRTDLIIRDQAFSFYIRNGIGVDEHELLEYFETVERLRDFRVHPVDYNADLTTSALQENHKKPGHQIRQEFTEFKRVLIEKAQNHSLTSHDLAKYVALSQIIY